MGEAIHRVGTDVSMRITCADGRNTFLMWPSKEIIKHNIDLKERDNMSKIVLEECTKWACLSLE